MPLPLALLGAVLPAVTGAITETARNITQGFSNSVSSIANGISTSIVAYSTELAKDSKFRDAATGLLSGLGGVGVKTADQLREVAIAPSAEIANLTIEIIRNLAEKQGLVKGATATNNDIDLLNIQIQQLALAGNNPQQIMTALGEDGPSLDRILGVYGAVLSLQMEKEKLEQAADEPSAEGGASSSSWSGVLIAVAIVVIVVIISLLSSKAATSLLFLSGLVALGYFTYRYFETSAALEDLRRSSTVTASGDNLILW